MTPLNPENNIDTRVFKDFTLSDDYEFFWDYNTNRYVSSVKVSYLPHEVEEIDSLAEELNIRRNKLNREELLGNVRSFDNFSDFLQWFKANLLPLYSKPYVILERKDYLFVKDRGILHRAKVNYARLMSILSYIQDKYKKHLKIKKRKGKHFTRHIVLTITTPRSLKWFEAFDYITKRKDEIIKYLDYHYGVLDYVGVLELHEDGFPHLHVLVVTKKALTVFKHKHLWRFSSKRKWDKDLKVNERGFIDCFALRKALQFKHRKSGLMRYFAKYISKAFSVKRNTSDTEANKDNPKDYLLFISRLLRKRIIYNSRISNEREDKPKITKEYTPEQHRLFSLILEKYRLEEAIFYGKAKDMEAFLKLSKVRKQIYDLIYISWNLENDLRRGIIKHGELEGYIRFIMDLFTREYLAINKRVIVLGSRVSFN